ncbi:hypothetical protein BHE90_017257 [Fusarium euwallaceae]|uniref:DUF7770 domain-containing protein n=1 Tax=Fusarium euwallaceae TaxID=1147111 RepID=A0A430KXY7_9HYPO|nr:hypothetical protein BHE90_017257 [Fusarium euwallaceae]
MDRNWDQDNFNEGDLGRTVKQIHICAYVNENNEGDGEDPPTNHWATFLEISPTHSVRMDMAPGYGSDGLRGKIEISSKRYRFTNKAIHGLSFNVIGKPKVGDIINLINSNGLQKYTFTPEWEGCRFWVYTLILHLEQQGIVEPESASRAWGAVSYYYINPSGYDVREVRQGTFRSLE